MSKVRIGFLTRSFSPETRSSVPLVMRALVEAGAIVDVIHPIAGPTNLGRLRIEHDLYVLKQMSGLAMSIAGALHAQGAAIVNPYPVTAALNDKVIAFRVLQRAGVPTPDTYLISQPIELTPLLETGPLIVKPIRGWDGHGVRVISRASELADLPATKEPVFAQRYIAPEGPELKMFAIGGRVFGVKREVQLHAKGGRAGEPFTPAPELRRVVLRSGEAFGIDLFGVDVIEREGTPYVVDMNSIPGFKGVPDGPLRVARYLYEAAERAARGEPVFESALPRELASTAGLS
jgi:ribosomal protein S6--L-glutamate ligase